jgi:uncharacterized protein YndB with AHSA1/START domain
MPTVETSIEIQAPPGTLWDFISDLDRIPEWVTFTDEMLEVPEGEAREGSVYREYGGVGPKKGESTWTITRFDPPSVQVHEGDLGVMEPTLTMRVEPAGDGARLTHTVAFRFLPGFRPLGWLLEKLFVVRAFRSGLEKTQRNAKAIVEDEAGDPA